jgi:hypothetical protein
MLTQVCTSITHEVDHIPDYTADFLQPLGDPNATPAKQSTGTRNAYAFKNSQTGDFDVREFTTANVLPYPQFASRFLG